MAGIKSNTVKYLIIVVPLLIIGIVASLFAAEKYMGKYSGYREKNRVAFSVGERSFYNNSNRLYVCTEDGTQGYDAGGGLMLSLAYSFANPCVISRGKITAVCEQNGYHVYVISENGIPYGYTTESPIVKMCLAADGTTAVLLNSGSKDVIRVYSLTGEGVTEIGTTTMNDGFPVDIALSEDGMKLATLYICFEGDEIVSKVTFYNRGEVGRNYVENIVGQKIYNGEAVYDIEFLGNDNIGIMFKDGFALYEMKQLPSLVTEQHFISPTKEILFDDSCIASVIKKDNDFKLSFWDMEGRCVSEHVFPNYMDITLKNGEAMVLYTGTLVILRENGTVKYNGEVQGNISKVFSGGDNAYFLVDGTSFTAIELER